MLKKISPVNGFDVTDAKNTRQNNYLWSLAEFDGYIYAGTGRNIVAIGIANFGLKPLEKVMPPVPLDNLAEIWRIPVSGKNKTWEKVFKAKAESKVYGFREMITHTDKNGVPGLCIGAISLDKSTNFLYYTKDGKNFLRLPAEMPAGLNTRVFAEFNGVLYCGANTVVGTGKTSLLYMTDYDEGFKSIDLPDYINDSIMSMAEYSGHLYIGTSSGNGFNIWKSANPHGGEWKLIVDNGAGDKLNELAMTMQVFKGNLYISSGVTGGTISVDEEKKFVPFKGFDLIRVDRHDKWEVIAGGTPINPIKTKTGKRNLGRYSSGFGNAFNCYGWQMIVYKDKLYVSSWDSALIYKDIIINEILGGNLQNLGLDTNNLYSKENLDILAKHIGIESEHYDWAKWAARVISSLTRYPREHGFDLYVSKDGKNFRAESLNGFNNPENYGLRTMLVSSDEKLYFGTANVYEGCEAWVEDGRGGGDDCCCPCPCCFPNILSR